MATYIATELSFIDGRLVQPGDEVEYSGSEVHTNLKKKSSKAKAAATTDPDPEGGSGDSSLA
jgi:hypothetical protein